MTVLRHPACFAILGIVSFACNVTVENTRPTDPVPTSAPTVVKTAEASSKPEVPPKMCTEMGCLNGLNLEIEPKAAMKKGAYVFEIEADGKRIRCEGKLPLPACDKGPALTCKGDVEVQIAESGCALPKAEHSFGPITLKAAPASVKITVSRDGSAIGMADLKPVYKTVQPNGPDCGPTCKQASDSITIK